MIRKVSIRKTADSRYANQWIVRWRMPGGSRPSRSFPTKALADQFANRISQELNAGELGTVTPLAWDDLVKKFLLAKAADQLSRLTIELYSRTLNRFGEICCYPRSTDIRSDHIDLYKNERLGLAATTLNGDLRIIKNLLRWAQERSHLAKAPKITMLREQLKPRESFTPAQFAKVLEVCHDPQWRCLMHLAVNGIARKQSLIQLELSDVDFGAGTIRVFDSKTKQWKARPVHQATMKVLTEYATELPDGRVRLFTRKFHNKTWERIVAKAGVPYIKFHHLRTCMSTWLKQAGVSGDVVTKILGHSSPDITYKHYTALDDMDTMRKAIDQLPL